MHIVNLEDWISSLLGYAAYISTGLSYRKKTAFDLLFVISLNKKYNHANEHHPIALLSSTSFHKEW